MQQIKKEITSYSQAVKYLPYREKLSLDIIRCAEDVIVAHFSNVHAIFQNPELRQQMEQLDVDTMEMVLKSDSLATNTENYVYRMLEFWIAAQEDRKQHVSRLLPHIRFPMCCSIGFIMDIISTHPVIGKSDIFMVKSVI